MGDPAELTATAAPRTSVEKLEEALEQLAQARGEGAGDRMLLQTLKSCIPALRKLGYIPDDPAELDRVLELCARWAASMRSDDAPPIDPQELPE
jgi:hypothetical protein